MSDKSHPQLLPLVKYEEGDDEHHNFVNVSSHSSLSSCSLRDPKMWFSIAVLVALTVADQVLSAVMFDVYSETYSQFLNQATAAVYGIVSIVIMCGIAMCKQTESTTSLSPSSLLEDEEAGDLITATPTNAKQQKDKISAKSLIFIGLINGGGNFCMAVAQPHTPALTQSLLYVLGVPLVLILSRIFLRKRPTVLAAFGAAIIVLGTILSGLRSVLFTSAGDGNGGIEVFWYSVLLFAFGQVFLSAEKVFEEHTFSSQTKKSVSFILTMFCWTVWTQFILGWALYPVQTVEQFGGLSMSDLPSVVRDGLRCTISLPPLGSNHPSCDTRHSILFFTYCAVDFSTYAFGLFVIQKYGANLMAVTSAVALPMQQIVLCIHPLMGSYYEVFRWTDGVALILVLAGFVLYHVFS
eukprot:PhM_4_TR2901/c0_g1_i1/m.55292